MRAAVEPDDFFPSFFALPSSSSSSNSLSNIIKRKNIDKSIGRRDAAAADSHICNLSFSSLPLPIKRKGQQVNRDERSRRKGATFLIEEPIEKFITARGALSSSRNQIKKNTVEFWPFIIERRLSIKLLVPLRMAARLALRHTDDLGKRRVQMGGVNEISRRLPKIVGVRSKNGAHA